MSKPYITEAYGWLHTDKGGSFDLQGDFFVRTLPVKHGPCFTVADLPNHLKGLKVIGIGEEEVGEEAGVLISILGDELDFTTVAEVNEFFGL